MLDLAVYCVPVLGAVGLAFSTWRYWWVVDQDAGNDQMKEIGERIQRGAMAFLKAEYTVLLGFLIMAWLLSELVSSKFRSYATSLFYPLVNVFESNVVSIFLTQRKYSSSIDRIRGGDLATSST